MPQTALGNLGLNYEHTLGVDNWKNSYDANWCVVDSLGGQGFILNHTLLAEPGAPAVGDAYILPTGTKTGTNWGSDTGAVTNAVALYTNVPGQTDGSPWLYLTPREAWSLWDRTNNVRLWFDGSKWIRNGEPKLQVHVLGDTLGNYTFGSLDANALVGIGSTFDAASDSLIVPDDATYDFPIGTTIIIHNDDTQTVQIQDGASVTWHDEDPTAWAGLPPQSWMTIRKFAANLWHITDLDLRLTHNTDLTGFAATVPNVDIRLRRTLEMISARIPTFTGTSNAASMTVNTVLPVAFRPANAHAKIARVEDNGGGQALGIVTFGADGSVVYGLGLANGTFTASGTKGAAGLTFNYSRA